MTQFTEQPTIEMGIQTRQDNRRHTIRFQYLVRVMIMVDLCLPWLALGASHKPNSAKDSVQSHASIFCKVNSTKKSVQSRVSILCDMLNSCSQKNKW